MTKIFKTLLMATAISGFIAAPVIAHAANAEVATKPTAQKKKGQGMKALQARIAKLEAASNVSSEEQTCPNSPPVERVKKTVKECNIRGAKYGIAMRPGTKHGCLPVEPVCRLTPQTTPRYVAPRVTTSTYTVQPCPDGSAPKRDFDGVYKCAPVDYRVAEVRTTRSAPAPRAPDVLPSKVVETGYDLNADIARANDDPAFGNQLEETTLDVSNNEVLGKAIGAGVNTLGYIGSAAIFAGAQGDTIIGDTIVSTTTSIAAVADTQSHGSGADIVVNPTGRTQGHGVGALGTGSGISTGSTGTRGGQTMGSGDQLRRTDDNIS